MQPLEVVIPHISGHILLHKISCWLMHLEYPIVLQTTEESLNNRIIPTSTNITHARTHIIAAE